MPISPVERACGRPRLRLDRPGGLRLGQLKQEAPITCPPAKQRLATASRRMPKIILTLGNGGEKRGPFPRHCEMLIVGPRVEVAYGIPCGSVWQYARRSGREILLSMRRRRETKFSAVARCDE